ncbi:LURP-one-related/scramblase family protein [Scatolibacter rhodanostii]|uniref:LURP-one-related/scramblase family protein n=1 Tax=Scatolibacter rhodanostii TaxID=2014781 RepID=UPI000C07AA20|nr:LURP-one-related family protein [Scatolibacter rhodanostii]
MKLLFKQRLFSWFDSYDIYDEAGNVAFVVKGRLSWGHLLEIYDAAGYHIGTLKEEIFHFMPRFSMYFGDQYVGQIRKEFTFFKPSFQLDCNGWQVSGDLFSWNYQVYEPSGNIVMSAEKQIFNWTDTYVIDIAHTENALISLMIVLAIDAANCEKRD